MADPPGGVPERPKGAVCKTVGSAYGGSNPPAPIFPRTAFAARLCRVAFAFLLGARPSGAHWLVVDGSSASELAVGRRGLATSPRRGTRPGSLSSRCNRRGTFGGVTLRLSTSNLEAIERRGIPVPHYDRAALTPRIGKDSALAVRRRQETARLRKQESPVRLRRQSPRSRESRTTFTS